jgi:hypothetical protein
MKACPECGKALEEYGPVLACLECGHTEESYDTLPVDDYEDYSDFGDAT